MPLEFGATMSRWILMLWFLMSTGCETAVISVHVEGLAQDIHSLTFSGTRLGSERVLFSGSVTDPLDRFVLRLSSMNAGALELRVRAMDLTGCGILEGRTGFVANPGESVEISLQLIRREDPCTVSIALVGQEQGMVRSDPPRIECGLGKTNCSGRFPPGTAVHLSVVEGRDGHFAGWSGVCSGSGPCDLVAGDDRTAIRAAFAPRQICYKTDSGSLCWEHPLPQGNHLSSVWVISASEAWAVGRAGTILRRFGIAWIPVHSPVQVDLWGVWGSQPDDVWIVGAGEAILHWDGKKIEVMNPPKGTNVLLGVFGFQTNRGQEIWAVGLDGRIVGPPGVVLNRRPGTGWHRETFSSCAFVDIAGAIPEELWAVGSCVKNGQQRAAVLRRRDRGTWEEVSLPRLPGDRLERLAIWDRSHVWAVGRQGSIVFYAKQEDNWQVQASGTEQDLFDVSAVSANEAWAVGNRGVIRRLSGGRWQAVDSHTFLDLRSVGASDSRDLWIVGRSGSLLRWNGGSLLAQSTTAPEHVYGLWSDGKAAQAIDYSGTIWNRIAGKWVMQGDSGAAGILFRFAWRGLENIWAVGPEFEG